MAKRRENFGRLITEICAEEEISCTPMSDAWAFRLEKNRQHRYLVGYHFPLNAGSSRELCQDKSLTYETLKNAHIPACPHFFLPNPAIGNAAMYQDSFRKGEAYLAEGRTLVIKDNYGTGGRAVYRADSRTEFEEHLQTIYVSSYGASVSPFYEIREEYRIVMLDGEAQFTIRKERESITRPDGSKEYLNWKHNLGQGATGILVEDPAILSRLYPLAQKTVDELNIRFASVDIIDTAEGMMVLEVNAGVMMEHFSGQNETCYRIAKEVYRKAIRKAFQE